MNCPACGRAVETKAKFCSECGASLRASGFGVRGSGIPELRTLHPEPRSYTPAHLVDKILSSRSALQGERKQVTVLFADVVGSMELAAQVEAETWHEILDRFFSVLTGAIHRVEGTINQYTGDGAMALFGAPIAHEDHAQRACHAALALRSELRRFADALRVSHGLSFSVRMGLNSGEVVVGRIGDDLRMDYTAQGHTVGLAARMEQLAEPGTVLLTEHTAQLVAGYFALRDLGPAHVKGSAEPLHVFELEGTGPLRTRLDRSRALGFANFVGRGDEMAALDVALAHALEGAGEVVGVEGDAGVGKSRLCAEFVGRCRTRGLSVYEAHCPSHGRTVPFLPILALLRSYFGIGERDGAAAARQKIAGRLLVRDDSAREALPVLYDFLGVADPSHPAPRMDPEARQRVLFTFVRRLVETRTDETVLIFLDDLHWIDAASDAFVAQLVEAASGTRTLLLLNYRPEYRAPWMQHSSFRRLALAPLAASATGALLDELLGTDPTLAPLRASILERTRGNPFFIEEVIRALVSDGTLERTMSGWAVRQPITSIRIPDTVHAVLAARIDRLVEADKAALQTAAVIGKTFNAALLQRVVTALGEGATAGASLQRLIDAGLIVDTADADEHFAFKHPLTQEVAYRSQLAGRRERVHRSVADVLEELHADRLDEVAAVLAHHRELAGELLGAARWHRRAAEWVGISDLAAAVGHWQRVRALVGELPESSETLRLQILANLRLLDLGWRSGMSPDEAATLFREGRALGERTGNPETTAFFLNTYGILIGMNGDIDAGLALVTEGAALARGSTGNHLMGLVALVQAQAMAGALQAARETVAEGLANEPANLGLGALSGGFSPYLYLVMMRGHIHTEMGHLHAARQDFERVFTLGAQRGEIELLGWAHEFAAYLAVAFGSFDEAIEHAQRSLDSAEKIGSPLSRVSAAYSLGAARLAHGDWNEAAAIIEHALSIRRTSGTGRHWEARGVALFAHAVAGNGDGERARMLADQAEALSRAGGDRFFECIACLAIARTRVLTDGAAAAAPIESTLARVEAIVSRSGAQLYSPWVHEIRATIAQKRGDAEGQRRELETAQRLFAAIRTEGPAPSR